MWSGQPTTTTNTTHDQLNRDAAIAAASGYDARGNLTFDGTRTFTYDAENRLRSVTGGPAAITLDYDAWGRLAKTTVGGVVTKLGYAGPNLSVEMGASNQVLRSYVSGQGTDSWLLWNEGSGAASTPRWLAQDRQGSVISVSDASGAVIPYTYGPYGEPQSWSGPRMRYTGQLSIPEAQLYHYRARAYDPVMGRFMQTDPIGYDDGPNVYAYVHGDPVKGVDPSGECEGLLSCIGAAFHWAFGGGSGTKPPTVNQPGTVRNVSNAGGAAGFEPTTQDTQAWKGCLGQCEPDTIVVTAAPTRGVGGAWIITGVSFGVAANAVIGGGGGIEIGAVIPPNLSLEDIQIYLSLSATGTVGSGASGTVNGSIVGGVSAGPITSGGSVSGTYVANGGLGLTGNMTAQLSGSQGTVSGGLGLGVGAYTGVGATYSGTVVGSIGSIFGH